jgi:hypothetical protein
MAFKKRVPILDMKPKLQCSVSDYPAKTVVLSDADFNTFARWIKTANFDVALGIQAATIANLKRLKVKAKGAEPVAGVPLGSDQVNIGCLVEWAALIEKGDLAAVEQLRRLGATVNARVS